ncbi:MAG TPA: phosphate ABC transporter permease PstA [Chthoniobacteraceae bacterium]|jgi:phosphate transport system permease protein
MHAPAKTTAGRTKGEQYVWVTSMGLAIGLTMVLCLFWLILSQGIAVFWPANVPQITFAPGLANGISENSILAGEIVKEQVRPGGSEKDLEWQLFLGNRDAYGFSFKYVNAADVGKVDFPRDLLVVERIEYGDAIGYPSFLEITGGEKILPTDPAFGRRFEALVEEANRRRRTIEQIEKREIGKISAEMQALKVRQAAAERKGQTGSGGGIEGRMAELQSGYEALAAKAADLRAEQQKAVFGYRLPTGEERTMPVGQVVHSYAPNALGWSGKLGLFLHNFWTFLSADPREANTEGGIFPAIFGTFVMTLLMSAAVMPFGIVAAIYLREYAKQGFFVRAVRIAVNNLAGVPSIVFGVFGLGFFVYFVGGTIDSLFFSDYLPTPTFGTGGILWASLTLALMTVPVIIVSTEEALASVSRGAREASLACGASKWQTIQNIVLPASSSGILTGLILAMARGAGEVAPLMLVGVVKLAPSLPLDLNFPFLHLDRKFMHLGFHIYDLGFQSPDSEAAKPMVFATTLFLILLVVVLNLSAILIRERLRRKYATGAF